jgi:hypothetical protein
VVEGGEVLVLQVGPVSGTKSDATWPRACRGTAVVGMCGGMTEGLCNNRLHIEIRQKELVIASIRV